jgi:hypothetical protein
MLTGAERVAWLVRDLCKNTVTREKHGKMTSERTAKNTWLTRANRIIKLRATSDTPRANHAPTLTV